MPEVYQLHILLREISPAIWRRVLVRSDSTITDLHYTIQILMGWSDYHLNKFTIHAKSYGVYHRGGLCFPDDPDEILLSDFEFRHKERFLYEYDFNVDWMIDIRLEERRALDPSQIYPVCISGSRAGPPEECGGPIAFMAWEDEFHPSLVVSRLQDLCEDQVDEMELYLHEIDHAKWWLGKEEFDRREINRRLDIYSKRDEEWYGAVFEQKESAMKAKVQVVIESEHGQLIVHDVATITRTTFSTGTLGLSLSEGKNLLQHLQASIVNQQVSEWLRDTRDCPICGSPRSLKGHHSLVCQTVFGKVQLDSPRLRHCPCEKADHRSFSPLSKRLSERTTPELAYLEAKWASLMSYGLTVDILSEVLPLEGQINTTSIRRQVERVADRVEQAMGPEKGIYLEGMERDWGKLPRPEEPITVGIDGGFVRGRDGKSRGEGHFEVIAGKSIAENDSKCFAYVTRYDEKPKRRLYEVLKSQGMQMNQQVTFLSDGAENVRTLQYDLNPHAEYILDWFHITMRLTVMRQMAKGLPGEEDPKATEKALDHLKRIKWYLWHGNVYRALQAVEDLTWHLDCLEPGEAQAKLFKTVEDFERYIHSNQTNITNYGYRYRNGERISTGFVESTINQVVSKRFVKKQQMRWTERGAHLLLQVRTKVLNDQLRDTFEGWYPEMKEAAQRFAPGLSCSPEKEHKTTIQSMQTEQRVLLKQHAEERSRVAEEHGTAIAAQRKELAQEAEQTENRLMVLLDQERLEAKANAKKLTADLEKMSHKSQTAREAVVALETKVNELTRQKDKLESDIATHLEANAELQESLDDQKSLTVSVEREFSAYKEEHKLGGELGALQDAVIVLQNQLREKADTKKK